MNLKNKYNLFYFIYCIVGCCLAGFVAVFLQYKGVSNTLIGLVTGIGCVSSVFLSPYLSGLIVRVEKLTAMNMLTGIYSFIAAVFLLLAFMPLPSAVVVGAYIIIYSVYVAVASFPQVIASGYMQDGEDIDFGLARGLGSASWAITALVMGPIVDFFSPVTLAIGFLMGHIAMVILLKTMPEPQSAHKTGEKGGSVFGIIKKYKVYFMVLVGFAFCLAAHSCLGTYLSNIVANLGGSTSMYGVTVFLMALSEMPVMAVASRWMKKVDSLTLITIGGIAYVIRNFTVCLAPNMLVLIIGLLFQSVSYGLLTAVVTYYVIYNLEAADQVMGQAMIGMITSGFGSTVGNMLGGVLQDTYGLGAMFVFACALTAIGAVVIFAAKAMDIKQKKTA